ncbi:N-acetylglucosamine/diacetylchitobiose ABC transporter substrate-binding protein [Jiangella endophytica]|uniref:N-acetylglucosamine/diacetylchitobiose ABC transporter substrate-binding protein n=1 Tax=Jiangella endophytica TaxID=1623398 RepID=UPI000E34F8E2|nr:N-acetylglucosamine/diacetylchitobiose ABC transporter substrate-binding protein [Jiangella endophytica]
MTHPTRALNRRTLLGLGAGLGALAGTGFLSACATSSSTRGGGESASPRATGDPDNPLGVPADLPLEAVIFKGGYGDQYAIDAQAVYQQRFPQAQIQHTGGQELAKLLQPRFVSGDVPDVICNAGAGALMLAPLVENGQLTDLTPLLDAPADGGDGRTVRDTLLPGVVEQGTFGGVPYALNYTFTVHGLYYSSALFDEHGWTYPGTWTEMLDLCQEIKDSTGMAPWTYQGKNPGYILTPLVMMAVKAGGRDVIDALDNLDPDGWTSAPMMESARAMYQLVERDFIMQGTSGLTHIQAQTYWANGEAAFIPCGSWLESELGDVTPDGFDMVIASPPALTDDDALPQAAIRGMGNEPFIVPAQAENPYGGMEFLRIMLSPASSQNFTRQTQTLTSLAEYDPQSAGTGLTSVRDALSASGDDTFFWRYGTWYSALQTEAANATSALMTGEIDPDEWGRRCQAAADAVREDDSIEKYGDQ